MSFYRKGPSSPRGPAGFGGMAGGLRVPGLTLTVRNLIIACVAMWLLQVISWLPPIRVGDGPPLPWLEGVLGNVPALSLAKGWIWQFVTYMFLHSQGDPLHLIFNMLMLWMFGSELERAWGGRRFLQFFLVCGIGAGVIAAVFNLLFSMPFIPTIGASGALFGLLIAYGIMFAERVILFIIFPMKARTLALIMIAMNVMMLLASGASGSTVSAISHLGGALVGYLYLKRAWRIGPFIQDMRWRWVRRKFKVVNKNDDFDRWSN